MNIQDLKSNTTWQEASNTINNNNNKISLAIATLEKAKLKNKGYFTSVEKLKEAIPNPTIGSKAYVGTSEPYAIYIVENGVWVDSGYTGGDESVANVTTDRIEDGAVTSEKIATTAFDSTLSVSGKIAPADVVGEKLTELEKEVIYDVTANNNGVTFESLSALLSSSDLSILIPTSVRYGGMTIRFVQSSDNKYVQYRLRTAEWSTNIKDWYNDFISVTANTENGGYNINLGNTPIANVAKQEDMDGFLYKGNLKKMGITSIFSIPNSKKNNGYYIINSDYISSIIDYPQYPSGVANTYYNAILVKDNLNTYIIDLIGNVWFKNSVENKWERYLMDKISPIDDTNKFRGFSGFLILSLIKDKTFKEIYSISKHRFNSGAYLNKDITLKKGDEIIYGVNNIAVSSLNYIEFSIKNNDDTYTLIGECKVGNEYRLVLPNDIKGIQFYMSATGTDNSIDCFLFPISSNGLFSQMFRINEMMSLASSKPTNNGSAYYYNVSPIKHMVKVKMQQSNLLDPICKSNLYLTGSPYQIVSTTRNASNIIELNGITSLYISGDLSEFNSGYFRYAFTSNYPKVGESVITSGYVTTNNMINVPNGAKYLLWTTGSQSVTSISSDAMLNYGTSALSYVQHVSEVSIFIADGDGESNGVTYTNVPTGKEFQFPSRYPSMYIRVTSPVAIRLTTSYKVDMREVFGVDVSKQSLFIGNDSKGALSTGMNIAIGGNNLQQGLGNKNITVGYDNLYNNSGSRNVSVGYHALFRNTNGNDNTSIGAESGDDNTSGKNNTSLGAYSLQRNTQGNNNVAVGYQAMKGTPDIYTEGIKVYDNVAIGKDALKTITTGMDNNIAIGSGAMSKDTTHSGCIVIGSNVQATKDNQMVLGAANITEVIVCGNKKILFNNDGTVTWETIS